MKPKIQQLIFNAETVAHLQGYERQILPATDLIREMVDIMEEYGILGDITFKEFDGIE